MKNLAFALVLFVTLFAFSKTNSQTAPQVYDYDSKWKTIDSLFNYGLPESGMKILTEVYAQAKSENNTPNFIRAVLYKFKLTQYNEEDAFFKRLEEMKAEESAAVFPVKQFLNSLIGDMFWSYYLSNRYNLLGRTNVVSYKLEDIKTWDAKKVIEQAIFYYRNSLLEPEKLQQVNIEAYNEMLNNYVYDKYVPNGRKYRPTLYDFLAFKAIGFFSNKEAGVTRPAEQFLLNDPIYLSDAKEFSALDITTNDVFSFDFYAINILKDLIKFHLADGNVDALVDADLTRIKFVNNNSGNAEKESLYLKALENLHNKFINYPVSTSVAFAIAEVYQTRGAKYVPGIADNFKDDYKLAYHICKEAIDRFPESDGSQNCRAMISSLEQKSLAVSLEAYNVPDKPFRTLATYRNVNKLYYKIVETSYGEIKNIEDEYYKINNYNKYQSGIIDKFKNRDAVQSFAVNFPEDPDLQTHKAEVKIPALSAGVYVLLVGSSETFSYTDNAVSFCLLNINNISYINKTNDKHDIEFFVLNRDTGNPLEGADATMYVEKYDYNVSRYTYNKTADYTSNKDGYFVISNVKQSRRFYLDINYQGQTLSTKGYNFGYGYNYLQDAFYQDVYTEKETKPYTQTFFFTDRSIYRPGQTLFFKGLVIESKGEERNIKVNESVTVELYDVNYQKVSEQNFLTNEFGTINGKFTLPSSGLNGQMHIRTSNSNGNAYFSVEDYKRPKFEVTFNPIKGAYKLGEMVPVKGLAKSYSGANLDNVSVKYRIVRKTFYPRWYYDWYSYYGSVNNSNDVEILNGTTTTNASGEFEINFKAVPDQSISKEFKPYFNYKVIADVTDVNGETHSQETMVAVGYNSLLLNIAMNPNVDKNGETKFKLSTTNLNGEKEPTEGNITIYKLKSPDKVFRSRLWAKPDKFIMTKEEYYRDFPYDEYSDESNYTTWDKEIKAFDTKFNTAEDSTVDLSVMRGWNQGKYVLEMTAKDKYGEDVIEKIYFNAYSTGETTMPFTGFSNFIDKKNSCEPGEKAEFIFGTSMNDTKVLFEAEGKSGTIKREWVTLNNNQRFFEIPIAESYRGGIAYNLVFVRANRIVSQSGSVYVPFTNKMLDMTFETFRNKLLPGENEQWKIKVRGKSGEKVAAEMLATMYDASLDAIKTHNWDFSLSNYYYYKPYYSNWASSICFDSYSGSVYQENWNKYTYGSSVVYDFLNYFGAPLSASYMYGYGYQELDGLTSKISMEKSVDIEQTGRVVTEYEKKEAPRKNGNKKDGKGIDDEKSKEESAPVVANERDKGKDSNKELSGVVPRKDFRETVFFNPDLRTDENGDLTISFTMPDALTKWKMMGFAHTKDLKSGFVTNELVTQKELMVTPNVPRYLREDDKVVISAKVTNLSRKDLEGEVDLYLFDALTMKVVDEQFKNTGASKRFEVKKDGSVSVSWEVAVPYGFEAIDYKVVAKAENFSDGEEAVLPVLSNRMLVTESLPMNVRGSETKTFSMGKLVGNTSNSLTNYRLSLEFTSNPAWYAVQSLPYLMEYPYECAEQVFSRLYANSIATHIVNTNPKIKEIFDRWRDKNPDALLSNLEKNEELKGLLLQETPWVLEAKDEGERKRRISTLFEMNIMRMELDRAVRKLKGMQVSNGAWAWFEGMPEDRYITQHIVAGFGKLNKLGIRKIEDDANVSDMVYGGVGYLDRQIKMDYERVLENVRLGYTKLSDNNTGSFQIHYLYTRSYFKDIAVDEENKEAFEYFKGQAAKYWNNRGWYVEGMIALALSRYGDEVVPMGIVKSLKENSLNSEELGMYWKENVWGYYWYEAPIETQALLIEVFDEVGKDAKSVDDMKVWLLKNKQTNDWKTTKATVEAIYALLLRGDDWLATDMLVDISVGSTKLDMSGAEAGTGYFKTSWKWGEIKPEMGNVTVTRKSATGISWGSLYWQYWEDLDKITKQETNLKLEKKLFVEENTSSGVVLKPIDGSLKVGDMVKVRIELRVDRDMEYVHMKDMRAAGFEPVNVLSQYKYQDGLGYYESTRDAATNFFFSYLPKGTYVFEYQLRVNLKGDYSNGITSIQCMYAPEFTSHSEGSRVSVNN